MTPRRRARAGTGCGARRSGTSSPPSCSWPTPSSSSGSWAACQASTATWWAPTRPRTRTFGTTTTTDPTPTTGGCLATAQRCGARPYPLARSRSGRTLMRWGRGAAGCRRTVRPSSRQCRRVTARRVTGTRAAARASMARTAATPTCSSRRGRQQPARASSSFSLASIGQGTLVGRPATCPPSQRTGSNRSKHHMLCSSSSPRMRSSTARSTASTRCSSSRRCMAPLQRSHPQAGHRRTACQKQDRARQHTGKATLWCQALGRCDAPLYWLQLCSIDS
mmetsp:Transcript_34153/g.86388  ORF Transcript_34153/g.86388 Transcript_34153/m.86388 type:complete len:278 (+) Transcript_34153:240-1073(+)